MNSVMTTEKTGEKKEEKKRKTHGSKVFLSVVNILYLHRNVKYEALWQMNFMNGFRIVWPILDCGAII